MKLNYKLAIFLTSLCLSASCKKDSNSSDEPSDTSTSEGEVDPEEEDTSILETSDNVLALSYPEGLSIGAFPVEVTQLDAETSGTLSVDLNLMSETPPSPQSPTSPDSSPTNEFNPHKKPIDKLADRKKIINGEIDTCFSEDIVRALTYSSKQSEICYGYDYGLVSGLALGKADLGQTFCRPTRDLNGHSRVIPSAAIHIFVTGNRGTRCRKVGLLAKHTEKID
jgi:hypothetical protein